jgi:hypothetical protein
MKNQTHNWCAGILAALILLAAPAELTAATTVSGPGTAVFTADGIDGFAENFEKISDRYGPALAGAYTMAAISGYPMGKAYLGDAPSFLLGVSLNAGLANMKYFDDSRTTEEGEYPAIAPNPTIFLGLGLGGGIDVMAKLLVYSDAFVRPPVDFPEASLKEMNYYSLGVKVRYNKIKEKKILPGLFNFGGVTFSGGVDLMYGSIVVEGSQEILLAQIEYTDPNPPNNPIVEDVTFTPDYTAELTNLIVTVNTQAIAYFDFFWIFSFYTGFGLALNFGSFSFDVDAEGECVAETNTIGDIVATSKNSYTPTTFVPLYIIGLDADIFLCKLSFETMVNLRNGEDINLQLGIRMQF